MHIPQGHFEAGIPNGMADVKGAGAEPVEVVAVADDRWASTPKLPPSGN